MGAGWPCPGRGLSSLAVALGLPWWRGWCSPSPLYKGGPRRGRGTHNKGHVPPLLSPWPPPSPSLPLSPARPPEGLRRIEITPPLHAVVLRSFQILSNTVYFCNLCWIGDSRDLRYHRTCASMQRCCLCGVGVVAPSSSTTLRSATSGSSTLLVRER
jgi:hypothetical protein